MNSSIPAFGAGNHNVAFAVGTVAFDPPARPAASGVWTAFQLESADGTQPSIVVKCWKELARYVLDHVKAGSQITAKGELEITSAGLAIKASFLELVPSGIRLPKPSRLLVTLSGVVCSDGHSLQENNQAAGARLKVLTGKAVHFELDLSGTYGQGGERLSMVRAGDYCLVQGALKQKPTSTGTWRPVVETCEVLAAYPFELPDAPPLAPPATAPTPQTIPLPAPKALPEAPKPPSEAPVRSKGNGAVGGTTLQKIGGEKVLISEESL